MFSMYEKELIVGEIFVRIYNDQPSYPLEVCGNFQAMFLYIVYNALCYTTLSD